MRIDPTVLGDTRTENKYVYTLKTENEPMRCLRETLCVGTFVAVWFACIPLVFVCMFYSHATHLTHEPKRCISHKHKTIAVFAAVVAWAWVCVFSVMLSSALSLSLSFSLGSRSQMYSDIVVRFMFNVSWNQRKSICFLQSAFFYSLHHIYTLYHIALHCIWSNKNCKIS